MKGSSSETAFFRGRVVSTFGGCTIALEHFPQNPWDCYIYLHLPYKSTKCRQIYPVPWILWVWKFQLNMASMPVMSLSLANGRSGGASDVNILRGEGDP